MSEPALLSRVMESEVCDERIDVPINSKVKEDVAFLARSKGFGAGGSASFVRSLIYRELYGELRRYDVPGNGRNGIKAP